MTSRKSSQEKIRRHFSTARRIVVKVGSSCLASTIEGLDLGRLNHLVKVIAERKQAGSEIILVSSGSIAAGLEPLGFSHRPKDTAQLQAAAAVGQGLLMSAYTQAFTNRGIKTAQVLLTREDLSRKTSFNNALRTFGALTRLGVVPVVNENDTVATQEIHFGDNDHLAVLVAELVRADALILLSDIDGLYTTHPDEPDAHLIDHVDNIDDLEVDVVRVGSAGVGRGGMASKIAAARMATMAGIPVGLARWDQAGQLLAGESVGTVFAAVGKRMSRRHGWLAHASATQGRLIVDAGATRALLETPASLLAAGICAIEGEFLAGDSVEVVSQDNDQVIARGLVGFNSVDLKKMLGQTSAENASSLGQRYARAVIHRDDLVFDS